MVLVTSTTSHAQGSRIITIDKKSVIGNPSMKHGNEKLGSAAEKMNRNSATGFTRSNRLIYETTMIRVPIRAARDFTIRDENIKDAKWFVTDGGYAASFLSKGIFTRVAYDEKGRWLYNLLEYSENKMDPKVRRVVKRAYYDCDILTTHQYDFPASKTIYLVKMQDQLQKGITLKVCDEEVEEITPDKKN